MFLLLTLLAAMVIGFASVGGATEVTIYPEEEVEETFESPKQDDLLLDLLEDSFLSTVLDVRTTTFFVTERSDSFDDNDHLLQSDESREDSESIDVFPWKSTQRIVFTMTNPVDTHQVEVLKFSASLHDQSGKPVPDVLPLVRVNEDIVL